MTEPVNIQTLGGLRYNANDVESAKNGTKPANEPGYVTTDNETFILTFKSGEKISYPKQDVGYAYYDKNGNKIPDSEVAGLPDEVKNAAPGTDLWGGITKVELLPEISLRKEDGFKYDDTYFNIANVMGATFTSSKKTVTNVTLNNCSDTVVDLAANKSAWYGDNATVNDGENNTVILDDEDTATINGKSVKGEGTAAQKDY